MDLLIFVKLGIIDRSLSKGKAMTQASHRFERLIKSSHPRLDRRKFPKNFNVKDLDEFNLYLFEIEKSTNTRINNDVLDALLDAKNEDITKQIARAFYVG